MPNEIARNKDALNHNENLDTSIEGRKLAGGALLDLERKSDKKDSLT